MISESGCKSGIYKIENIVNGKCYVGSAVDFRKRGKEHLRDLEKGRHQTKLQNAWDKYGTGAFEFSIIEYVAIKENLLGREQYWIDFLEVAKNGYNILPTAGSSLGAEQSVETREKMRQAHLGREFTESHKENIRKSAIGKKMPIAAILKGAATQRDAHVKRQENGIPHPRKGVKATADQVESNRVSQIMLNAERKAKGLPHPSAGIPKSESTKNKIRESLTGRSLTEDHKAAISAGNKGKIIPPESVAKTSATKKAINAKNREEGIPYRDEQTLRAAVLARAATRDKNKEKGKLYNTNAGFKHTPENLARRSATVRANNARNKELGIPHAKTGSKLTPESIAKRTATRAANRARDAALGIPHPKAGKPWSAESIAKLVATRAANKAKKLAEAALAASAITED